MWLAMRSPKPLWCDHQIPGRDGPPGAERQETLWLGVSGSSPLWGSAYQLPKGEHRSIASRVCIGKTPTEWMSTNSCFSC